jgi:hypothetical protein
MGISLCGERLVKKILMCALAVAISLSVASCADEEKPKPEPSQTSVQTTRDPGSNSSDAFPRILKKKADK